MTLGPTTQRRRIPLRLTGYRAIPHNRVKLLVDGGETYPAMLGALARARRSVALEVYIFEDDGTGQRFRDALVACAERDVAVRVIVDGVGSLGLGDEFWRPLREAGGQVQVYRPPRPWQLRASWRRDHRKILVVDDQTGFIGGLNIGDDHAPVSWGGRNWHDAHAEVEGPAARELTKVFNRTWRRLTREDWNPHLAPPVRAGKVEVQILESRLTQRLSVRRAYLDAIRQARHTVRISNAYFIPDRGVRRALRNARRRGVRVQLLLAGATDIQAVRYASRHLYSQMLRWGVEIYEWTERVLHAKTAVVDGRWCSIGSYNLDTRSLLHNLEANIACLDRRLGEHMEQHFKQDLRRSTRIDPQTWHRRPAIQKLLERFFFAVAFLL